MLSVISINWVKPRDAANHPIMDTGQPCNREWFGPNVNTAKLEKAWSTLKSRQGSETHCIRHYVVNSSPTPSFMKKLTGTQITASHLLLDPAANATFKLFHDYESWHLLFLHFKKNIFFFFKKRNLTSQAFLFSVRSRSWLLSLVPSPAQMKRRSEFLEERKSVANTKELAFLLQEDCIWNPGLPQHGQAGYLRRKSPFLLLNVIARSMLGALDERCLPEREETSETRNRGALVPIRYGRH